MIACALWVASLALMSFGSVDTEREGHNSPFFAWALFLAVIALVPTITHIIRSERERSDVTVERIVEIVDALHAGKKDVQRLR